MTCLLGRRSSMVVLWMTSSASVWQSACNLYRYDGSLPGSVTNIVYRNMQCAAALTARIIGLGRQCHVNRTGLSSISLICTIS